MARIRSIQSLTTYEENTMPALNIKPTHKPSITDYSAKSRGILERANLAH